MEHPSATPAQRLAARIVDTLIVYVPWGILVLLLSGGEHPNVAQQWIATGLLVVLGAVYEHATTTHWGATIGKRLVGIRIEHRTQGAPSWRIVGRLLLPLLWLACLPPPLCYLSLFLALPILKKYTRGLHDLTFNTRVVQVREKNQK